MNLVDFLKEVDQRAGKMSTEELVGFIHTVARMLPEQNRDTFLKQMKEGKEDKPVPEDSHGIEAAFEKIKIWDEKIKHFGNAWMCGEENSLIREPIWMMNLK